MDTNQAEQIALRILELKDASAALSSESDEKYGAKIKELQAQQEQEFGAQIKEVSDQLKATEAELQELTNGYGFETALVQVIRQKQKGSPPLRLLVAPSDLPVEFQKVDANKTAIKKAIRDGQDLSAVAVVEPVYVLKIELKV